MTDGKYDKLLSLVAKLLRCQAILMQSMATNLSRNDIIKVLDDPALIAYDGTAKEVIDEVKKHGIKDFWTA